MIIITTSARNTRRICPLFTRSRQLAKGDALISDKEKPIEAHALSVAVRRNLEWPLVDKKGNALYGKDGKPATENRLEVAKFTPHDLRRTAATFMASMGYMDEIIDAVLNHVKQGIIRTYNRHGYDQEKQMALEAWAVKLVSIVFGAKSKT